MAQQQSLNLALAIARPWLARYGLKVLLLLLVLGGVTWLWLTTAEFMPVKKISVTGELEQVTGATLRDVIAPLVTDGFVRMDVDQIRDQVESLPWVRQATVRRIWPDILAVEVVEQQVLARWGREALVNPEGELFYPSNVAEIDQVPQFTGIEGLSEVMAKRFVEFRDQLAEAQLEIDELSLNDRRAWSIQLVNGIELVLGRDLRAEKLARFTKSYAPALAAQAENITHVDLRYSNGFAVRWKTTKTG